MNRSLSRAIAASYEEIRLQTEQERLLRRSCIYRQHPELMKLDGMIAEAGAQLLFEAIDPDRPRAASEIKADLEGQRAQYLAQHAIETDFDQIRHRCPVCRDTGRIGESMCGCYRRVMLPLIIENANLKTLAGIFFKDFDASLFSDESNKDLYKSDLSPRQNIEAIRAALQRYTSEFETKGGNLLLLGRPGTGKTFLMACVANALLADGHAVFYISAPELFEVLAELRVQQASFQPEPVRLEQLNALHDSLMHAQLLLIDDLGTESRGANRYSELLTLVDRRLAPGLNTIISSNADPGMLKENYDERLLSRLMGHYSIYRFYGEDVRLQISRRRRAAN